MSDQTRRIATSPLLGYGCAAAGLVGGIAVFTLLPFAALAYMLPLGAALGGVAGVAQAQSTQQKIADGALGVFCGALAATFIPASPLALLGGVFGYGAGKSISMMTSALSPRIALPHRQHHAPETSPDLATEPAKSTLKAGLRHKFGGVHDVGHAQSGRTPATKTPAHRR